MAEDRNNRIILAQNLDRLMRLHSKTRRDLCNDLSISYMTLSDWLRGKTYPRIEKLERLAEYFGVSKSVLVEQHASQVPQINIPKAVRIPVFARVAAGIPIDAIEEVIDWEEISPEVAADGEYFAIRVKGDSMEPRITNGDVIIVRKQEDADDGDLVVALIDGNDAVCKRLRKYENGMVALISTNPAYDPMYFSKAEVDSVPVQIIGKVKELRAKF